MTENPHHSELEIKMDAEKVDLHSFLSWCFAKGPSSYKYIASPDTMYSNGNGNIIRHRYSADGEFNQTTVKLRKSSKSIKNRLEIDLDYASHIAVDDVQQFLLYTGWKEEFTLQKSAWVFFFEEVSVAIYTVYRKDLPKTKRTFLEVEINKHLNSDTSKCELILEQWRKDISKLFNVSKPLNESLWEIFSGKKYLKKKGKR